MGKSGYIPKSNIKIKYTSGNEYVYVANKDAYHTGPYIATGEGRYFAGNDPLKLTIEIQKKKDITPPTPRKALNKPFNKQKTFGNSTSFKVHKILKEGTFNYLKNTKPIPAFKPLPTQEDYKKGFINRYFVKRTNSDSEYKEISPFVYNSISKQEPHYDWKLHKVGRIKWSLKADSWITNAKQIALEQRKGFTNLIIAFPKLEEFQKATDENGNPLYDIKDRYYSDSEPISGSLPPSYKLPPNNNYQVVNGLIKPNTNPKCANCLFRQEGESFNHCTKWSNAVIRNHYWCKSWAPNINPINLNQYDINETSFEEWVGNQNLENATQDTFGNNVSPANNRPTGDSMGSSSRPTGGTTSGGGGGGY